MSLLSSTQGTPERVWSVLKIVEAHGGRLERSELLDWLNPRFTTKERGLRERTGEPDTQTIGAASSLNFIEKDGSGYKLRCALPQEYREFSDLVHTRLAASDSDDPDNVLFRAFAWVVLEVEREQSTGWLRSPGPALADKIDRAIASPSADGDRTFNSTKLAPWRRWLYFLGLAVDLPFDEFYPYVTERVWRELMRSDLPSGDELPINAVLDVIARRAPYLDNGAIFTELAQKSGFRLPPQQISRVLSTALRDLDEEGKLELVVHGDAMGVFQLSPDGLHRKRSVKGVVLHRRADNE